MSRIGNQPVRIPKGVDVAINDTQVTIKGPKGSLTETFHLGMKITKGDGVIKVERASDERDQRALHGLTRSLLANMVTGVSTGFVKSLELVGVGFRAQQAGKSVVLNVMRTHTVTIDPQPGVVLEVEGNNRVHVRGIDKQVVGQIAAKIRASRPPNPYTGKGVRYVGEEVKLKPGKSARRTV